MNITPTEGSLIPPRGSSHSTAHDRIVDDVNCLPPGLFTAADLLSSKDVARISSLHTTQRISSSHSNQSGHITTTTDYFLEYRISPGWLLSTLFEYNLASINSVKTPYLLLTIMAISNQPNCEKFLNIFLAFGLHGIYDYERRYPKNQNLQEFFDLKCILIACRRPSLQGKS